MAGPGPARYYSSTAVQTSLAAGISAANLSIQVNSTSGFPASTPFVLSLDQNSISEELVLVGNVSGTTLSNLTRGFNGTTAATHNNGASAVHVMCAQDLTDPQVHIGAFDNVHGVAIGSNVVGQNDTQTLTNKTLTSPTINTPTITTPTITGTSTTGAIVSSGAVTAVDFIASGLTGAQAASRYVGATTGGAPASGSFVVGDFAIDNVNGTIWLCTVAGSPGTWNSLITPNGTQTLANKTLTSPAITGTTTSTGEAQFTDFKPTGLTGAGSASRYVGATAGGAPTSGTFVVGDHIIDRLNGAVWVCTTAGSPGTWVPIYTAFSGNGQSTNMVTGGANRTTTMPVMYSTSVVVTVTAGSGWSYTIPTGQQTFVGVGSFHVTPGDNAGTLGFLTVIGANCSISAGALTLGGAAFQSGGGGVTTSANIRLNITVVGW